jgi:NAD-dependent dihydropyrimidine dehydrogenase PreA subunit
MLTAKEVRETALSLGADDVGIAPMERFEGAPPPMDPRQYFPGGKSVIGLVFRIGRGYIRGVEEGTDFFQYPSMGYASINEDFAPAVLYHLGRFIEDAGHEAAVFRNTGGRSPVSDMDGRPGFKESPEETRRACDYSVPPAVGKTAPDVQFHFRIAAYLCGLGEIGHSKMFLSRKFGPLNRQAFIITDAELEPDPVYDGEKICDRCMACAAACPGKCISVKERVKVSLAGHSVEWGKLDEWSCFLYYQGACRESNPFIPEDAFKSHPNGSELIKGKLRAGQEDYRPAANTLHSHYPTAAGYNTPTCGGCLRACASHLERKFLKKSFKNPFRTEKPWKLN